MCKPAVAQRNAWRIIGTLLEIRDVVTGHQSELRPAAWSKMMNRALAEQDAEQGAEHLAFFRTVLLSLTEDLDRKPLCLNNHPQKICNCSCCRTWSPTAPRALLELELSDSTAVAEFPHSQWHAERHEDKQNGASDIKEVNIA